MKKQTNRERLEQGLKHIGNARVRTQIRRIFQNEMPEASVFWDAEERQVELISDDWEIIVRSRE